MKSGGAVDVKWLILSSGRTHGVSQWSEAVASTARIGRVSAHLPLSADEIFRDDDCVVVNGVATDVERLVAARPWRASISLSDPKPFACETFLAAWGDVALQQDWRLLTIGEIARDRVRLIADFGEGGRIFLRPDAHDKAFDGGLYDVDALAAWQSQFAVGLGDKTRRCLIARPRPIDAEWRLFIASGRVVAGSTYRTAGRFDPNSSPPDDVAAFGSALARSPYVGLPGAYVVDVCRSEGRLKLVEVGSALSSGPYGSDRVAIVEAISAAARSCGIRRGD